LLKIPCNQRIQPHTFPLLRLPLRPQAPHLVFKRFAVVFLRRCYHCRMNRLNGHCILSHGFESGPEATKVTALAEAAARLGWSHERPDYTDLDARLEISPLGDVTARVERLRALAAAAAARGPLVLAGSSLGAWISGMVSLQVPVRGLFLMALPVQLGEDHPFQATSVPTSIVHGWNDELIPAQGVIEWAAPRRDRLLLVDDGHRLSEHVDASTEAFAALLTALK